MLNNFGLTIPLRDGVHVVADVYLPHDEAPVPAVFTGTPYGKNSASTLVAARRFTQNGYAFVAVDVRGRGDSEGTFQHYRNEGPDWYDAIEWVADQSWCDGGVAAFGASYAGASSWLAALEQPPHLRAVISYCSPSDPFVDYPIGVHLPIEANWFRRVDGRVLQNPDASDWEAVYNSLPLRDFDQAAGFTSRNWRADMARSVADTAYWEPLQFQNRLARLQVPALVITGWYDDVQPGSTLTFARLMAENVTDLTAEHRLLIGHWGHDAGLQGGRTIGVRDFGAEAEAVSVFDAERRFLNRHLRNLAPDPADADPRVHLFLMGGGEWIESTTWPLAEAIETSFFLTSTAGANTLHGDGILTAAPAGAGSDTLVYDPRDPVPFVTGLGSAQIGGADDYREIAERADVLVYETPELTDDVDVVGPVRLEAHVSSDRLDTDITARLVDIAPDGSRVRITDGVLRLRFREGLDREVLLTPGEIVPVTVDLWSTAQRFPAGHRIGLEVSSSAFPQINRNLNTGGDLATETEPLVAHNTLWHGADHPSRLVVPVLPPRN